MVEKDSGKSILILGCGYLGLRLAAGAAASGMRVKAVSRNLDTLEAARSLGAETFAGLVDEEAWHGFAGCGIDFVVNCVSSAGGGLEGYRQSYVGGNASLCQWAAASGFAGRAIYTSSVSVYPDAGGGWVDESCSEAPESGRGTLVRESEQVFLEGLRQGAAVVLRLAGLYGPGRHLMLDSVARAGDALPGWGGYYLNLARIDDVTSAVWAVLEQDRLPGQVYNVVDDEPSLKEDMVAWLAQRLGRSAPSFTGEPPASGRNSRRFGEGGPPANRRISNRALRAATGWRPAYPSFREGFADLMERGPGG